MTGSNFVDYIKVFCRAGNGGAGSAHLRREKFIPKGGPDGGDGGRGGHVIVRGNDQMWTLLHLKFRRHIFAEHGGRGGMQQCTGADGKDVIIEVPLGTVAKIADTENVLFEITSHGEEKILAKGGRGGLGNVHFKSSTNQTPRYAQPGEEGISDWYILELKILADVGLVGFPNAGKSTLLSVVSAAKPRIADYPFTTLVPNLGVIKLEDFRSFVVADIPGLIEGAHKGAGLGFQFLRHVERTSILLHLVDISVMAVEDPVDNYRKINRELALYSPSPINKYQAVVATKLDIADKKRLDRLRRYCKTNGIDFFEISAVTGKGIKELLAYLSVKVEEKRKGTV